MSLSDRLEANERRYEKTEQNVKEMQYAMDWARRAFPNLEQLINREIKAREKRNAGLEPYWSVTLMLAFLGGLFGAIFSAAASRIANDILDAVRSWWTG